MYSRFPTYRRVRKSRTTSGLAIIAQALIELPPKPRSTPAPAPPRAPRPDPEPAPEPDYFLSDSDRHNVAAVVFSLRLAKFTGKRGLRASCYHDAGVYLLRLRRQHARIEWRPS